MWNNGLVQNWEKGTSRLYIVTMLIYLICRIHHTKCWVDFTGGTVVNNLSANTRDTRDVGSILGSERYPRVGTGNPLQYSCLENSMDRGAWQATVHGVAKRWT